MSLRYQGYGLTIASELALPELFPIADVESRTEPDVHVYLRMGHKKYSSPSHWLLTYAVPTGGLWLACARHRDGYLLRFPGLADFFVDALGGKIVCTAEPETPTDTLRHLVLDQVFPLVLHLRGQVALHATAVLLPFGVCAFTGPAGTGKSTLAASFLRSGYPVMSDDCLVVEEHNEEVYALPSYPGLRLWGDTREALCGVSSSSLPVAHYTSKQRLILTDQHRYALTTRYPVAGIYSLVRPTEVGEEADLTKPSIERLSWRDGIVELLSHIFRLDITNRSASIRELDFLKRVTTQIPVCRLWIPNAFSALPAVREAVMADLRGKEKDQ